MKDASEPILIEWAIVKVSVPNKPGRPAYLFTGIGYGHPRLPDGCQFVTTEVQEIGDDGTWGRTRSRVYSLTNSLDRSGFTDELADEVKGIIRQEVGLDVAVEWISIDDWRVEKAGSGSPAKSDTQA